MLEMYTAFGATRLHTTKAMDTHQCCTSLTKDSSFGRLTVSCKQQKVQPPNSNPNASGSSTVNNIKNSVIINGSNITNFSIKSTLGQKRRNECTPRAKSKHLQKETIVVEEDIPPPPPPPPKRS